MKWPFSFDDWLEIFIGDFATDISPEQTHSLQRIDEEFSRFSKPNPAHEDFWTDDAVRYSPDWESIRQLARDALSLFGWTDHENLSH